jgi:hypothetical protein
MPPSPTPPYRPSTPTPQRSAWVKYGGGWPPKGRRPSSAGGRTVRFVLGLVLAAVVLAVGVSKWDEISGEIDELRSRTDGSGTSEQPQPPEGP